MRYIFIGLFFISLCGCASLHVKQDVVSGIIPEQAVPQTGNGCLGSVELPIKFAPLFEPAENEALLKSALGEPTKGGLCQGKVYKVKGTGVTLYRAWNSTNPNSRLGAWWAFFQPEGKTALYRSDYEICYQWSPLDKLTRCDFNAGTEVVVGTGQKSMIS